MSETPDRPHRTGAVWLDFVVALSAVAISLVSLWVASRADRTQERLLAAGVWPYVEFSTSNFADNVPAIELSLRNAGVGPAKIRWMRVEYRDSVVRSAQQFFSRCCNGVPAHPLSRALITSTVSHTVLVPRETVNFAVVGPKGVDASDYRALDHARHKLTVQVCYCSVLEDCWMLDTHAQEDPEPVGKCPQTPADAFED